MTYLRHGFVSSSNTSDMVRRDLVDAPECLLRRFPLGNSSKQCLTDVLSSPRASATNGKGEERTDGLRSWPTAAPQDHRRFSPQRRFCQPDPRWKGCEQYLGERRPMIHRTLCVRARRKVSSVADWQGKCSSRSRFPAVESFVVAGVGRLMEGRHGEVRRNRRRKQERSR